MPDISPNKNLGQHWLSDEGILQEIADSADLSADDTVLEIGPGLGTLTAVLAKKSGRVVAVEFDERLANELLCRPELPPRHSELAEESSKKCHSGLDPESKLQIIHADFLQFDLNQLPKNYKVVANIPYYITNKIIMKLLTAENKPQIAVLLTQKEVAERLAAKPGAMSILSVAAQFYADVDLGPIVPAAKFDPPPQVDSQVVILRPYNCHPGLVSGSSINLSSSDLGPVGSRKSHGFRIKSGMTEDGFDDKEFFRIVKAGFSQRRKKLRTSLAGGLQISKTDAENWLKKAQIDPNQRAQDLSLADWVKLTKSVKLKL